MVPAPGLDALVTAELVELSLEGADAEAGTRHLAELALATGRITDLEGFLADVAARAAQMPAALEGGVGIPHCRSAHVTVPTVVFGRSRAGIDYGAPDGSAHLVFLMAVPAEAGSDYLRILAALARNLQTRNFRGYLTTATDPAKIASYLDESLTG